MAKWCDEGEYRVADILFGAQAVDTNTYLGLYLDVAEPAEAATLSGLSEVSGSGYARIALARGTWSISGDYATYAQQTFTAGAAWGEVYGYFLGTTLDNTGKLLCVENFSDSPYDVGTGDSVKITPKITVA